jgi:RimJ/RimL family protein N-acetyltransferase
MFMLPSIEIHPGLLVGVKFRDSHHTAATRSRGGLDGYQSRARDRRPLAVPAEREKIRLGGGPRRRALGGAKCNGEIIDAKKARETMLLLDTQRLILRPFQDSDLEPFVAYRSDPDVARYQSGELPYTKEQAAAFLQRQKRGQPGSQGEWYQLAIERKQHAGLIGDCAFHVLAHDARQAEIGFSLARQYQRQGYATEAVLRLLEYLFGGLSRARSASWRDFERTEREP